MLSRRSALATLGALALLPAMRPTTAKAIEPIKIGVIGAGWLGGTVGRLWVEAGHEVMFSSRHPEELQSMAREAGPRASVGLPAAAAEFGSVLLLAVPYDAVPQIGRDLRQSIQGKIVLDATNPPISGGGGGASAEARANGIGQTTVKYMPGARVVRAFNCVDATVIATSRQRQPHIGIPIASDDQDALQLASGLVTDAGCDPVITGNLASAVIFQQGNPGWRANLPADQLRRRLNVAL